MTKRRQAELGFTMIELLTVVSIFGILAVVSANLFFSSLAGSTKEGVIRQIKENGDFSVTQIENSLRAAKRIVANSGGDTCVNGMSLVAYEDLNGSVTELGVVDGRLAFDGSNYLTSSNLVVNEVVGSGKEFMVNCRQDANSGVTFVEVSFTLTKGGGVGDDPEESFESDFRASVSLRNR